MEKKRKTYPKIKEAEVMAVIYAKRGKGVFSHSELVDWVMEIYPERRKHDIYKRLLTVLNNIPVKSMGKKIFALSEDCFNPLSSTVEEPAKKKLTVKIPAPIAETMEASLNSSSEQKDIIAAQVIDYFNAVTSSRLKPVKANLKLIKQRLEEGFTLEDCKQVIDIKNKEWKGTPFEKFIRIETLFTGKFVSYLNQKETFNSPVEKMASYDFEKYVKGDK